VTAAVDVGDPEPVADLVDCVRVSRHYRAGAVWAVRELDCWVSPGMAVALTGPSGSGKSTLLHLMAGLEAPTSGRITWPALGGCPLELPGRVGVVFQSPSLVPDLDAAENVGLPLLFAGESITVVQARVHEALQVVGIGELATKLPEELSGGEAQRVALARALITRPRLILADEPTGQLDRATGEHVITVLLNAAAELDAGLVVATHDPSVAERFAVRWRMCDGQLHAPEHTDGSAVPTQEASR
jgi:putative ABC transport system ATP-binding protein